MTRTHARASDPEMTRLQRFLTWWKEYGTHLLALLALLVSALVWFAGETGFAVIGPRDAVSQVKTTLTARADRDSMRLDSLLTEHVAIRRAADSTKGEVTYALRSIEAGNRVICFRDRPAAEVAGILCPSGKVPR